MSDEIRATTGDSTWFVQDRLGMFIHWGLYALPARHEWIRNYEEISNEDYEKYFQHFDPDLYDPDRWAELAAGAGMKYFVITTKHHEGFCLWDSKLTDYKAPNTPAGRDLLGPMVQAFRAQGLRVGFYHSLIDWHHPDFTIDEVHPLRNHPDRKKLNEPRDIRKYTEYLHGQVRELLSEYGKVDVMWFDFSYPPGRRGFPPPPWEGKGREDWQSAELLKLVRSLQPGILLNDRLDLTDDPAGWDIRTPEQITPRAWVTFDGQRVVWESCQTFSGSWGYHRDEESWKSTEMLVQMLIDTVSKGGNLLLNVGPTGRGEFDYRAVERLEGMGEWMRQHSRSIYGCTAAPEEFKVPRDCRFTYNPETRRLYLHLFAWPCKMIELEGMAGKIEYAQLLNDASEIQMQVSESSADHFDAPPAESLTLTLPVKKPNATVPVVELYLK
ncbi:MAG: alpha-L-fucosidase [candidate division WS1 bacterium]|nr:alpha-L-fucosidase [candidate division WS1 bacterium]